MKIKYFIAGLLIGLLCIIPIAWAAQRATLVNGGGTEVGTTSNPLVIAWE